MWEPRPGTSPKARTSKLPPRLSFALRSRLISSTIAALASGSRQRTGSSSTPVEVGGTEVGPLRRPHRGDLEHVAVDADAERGEEAAGDRAGGDAGGGLAGAGPLEHVADVGVAVLLGADQVGVARAAAGGPRRPRTPRPARGSSAPPSWRSRGWRRGPRSGCPACGRGARPERISTESDSIFIRPPRPWPSWRRAMSRSSASRSSSSPAGMPSTIATRPGPCDSPAVVKRKPRHRGQGYTQALRRRSPRRSRLRFLRSRTPLDALLDAAAPWLRRSTFSRTRLLPSFVSRTLVIAQVWIGSDDHAAPAGAVRRTSLTPLPVSETVPALGDFDQQAAGPESSC